MKSLRFSVLLVLGLVTSILSWAEGTASVPASNTAVCAGKLKPSDKRRYTPAEEVDALIRKARQSDGLERDRALTVVFREFRSLIDTLVWKNCRRLWVENFNECRSEAYLGFANSLEAYDPDRGVPFYSFTKKHIKGAISSYLRESILILEGVRYSTRAFRKHGNSIRKRLSGNDGFRSDVTADDISREFGIPLNQARAINEIVTAQRIELDRESETYAEPKAESQYDRVVDSYSDEELEYDLEADLLLRSNNAALVANLERFNDQLSSDRDKVIFRERIYIESGETPPSLREMGERLGISGERVRQLEERIRRRLKEFLQLQGYQLNGS